MGNWGQFFFFFFFLSTPHQPKVKVPGLKCPFKRGKRMIELSIWSITSVTIELGGCKWG